MTCRRYTLWQDQWHRLKDLLPGREGHVGGTALMQSVVRGSCVISLPSRYPVARLTRTVWGLPSGTHALGVAGQKVGCGNESLRY